MFKFLKKLWNILKVLLIIILICLAVYFSFGGALVLFGATFTGVWAALLAVGLAFIVDPKTSGAALASVGKGVSAAAGAAIGVITGGVSAVIQSSGLLKFGLVGFALYLFLSRDKSKDAPDKPERKFVKSGGDEKFAFGSTE